MSSYVAMQVSDGGAMSSKAVFMADAGRLQQSPYIYAHRNRRGHIRNKDTGTYTSFWTSGLPYADAMPSHEQLQSLLAMMPQGVCREATRKRQ